MMVFPQMCNCQFHRHYCAPIQLAEMQAFELSADNEPEGPSVILSREHNIHVFQKDFQMLSFQFSTFPQSILNKL